MPPSSHYSQLLLSSPSAHITATKLPTLPYLLSLLPLSLLSLLTSLFCSAPRRRELMIVGGYVYKFDAGSRELRGTPVPLASASASLSKSPFDPSVPTLLLVTSTPFSTKSRHYILPSPSDYTFFLSTLSSRRAENVKRTMGHTQVDSDDWIRADRIAEGLEKRRNRIKEMVGRKEGGDLEETRGLLMR